jgi:hypothetical protein
LDLLSSATSFLPKILWSAVLVLGITFVAERVSTRIAGLLAGAPQNAMLVYFFVARDMGIPFVVESAPHGAASFSATVAFVLAYYAGSSLVPRYSIVTGPLAGVATFVAVAAILAEIPFTLATGAILTLCVILGTSRLFLRIADAPVANPVRYTPRLLLLRSSLAVALIVGGIALAKALGPAWTGLMAGFPATLLPTLMIIHGTYGAANTHAVIRNFPFGVGSIVLYTLCIPVAFPLLGVWGGTAACLAVSLVYLAAVAFWGRRRRVTATDQGR